MMSLSKSSVVLAVMVLSGVAFAETPQPYIWWKMDKVVDGKVPNSGTNTNVKCDLTLGPAVVRKTVHGVENAIYFDASTEVTRDSYASSWTPALKSRTVVFWICRDADDAKFDPTQNKMHYVFAGLSRMNVMLEPGANRTSMTVKLGQKEGSSEQIAHSYFKNAASFTRDFWHQVAIVLEDTGRTSGENEGDYSGKPIYDFYTYQDGQLYSKVEGRVTEGDLDRSTEFWFGNNGNNSNRTVPGAFSDVRIYDCALTAEDIADLWTADGPGHSYSVLGFWRMEKIETDEKGVRMIADSSGKGEPLVVGDDNVIVENGGVYGSALDFTDEMSNYGLVANKAVPPRDFTVSMWMYPKKGMDKLEKEGHVGNKSPNLFNFGPTYFRCTFGNLGDKNNDLATCDMATLTNGNASAFYTQNGYVAKGQWNHFVFVAQAEQDEEGKWSVTPKFYCNGKFVAFGRKASCPAFETTGRYPDSLKFILGNMNYPSYNRAMWSMVDDVALFGRALTDREVQLAYQGTPVVEAGTDFTVVGASARLAGSLSLRQGGIWPRAAGSDSAVWSLVSAPEGAKALIAAPDDLATAVTLPVEGEYVFRLTASCLGLVSVSDEVTVTRVAATSGAAPTVSVMAPATAFVGESVTASAIAGGGEAPVRVFWSKVSGPGAVGFGPKEGTSTELTFHEAGAYVVRVTADDGERTSSQDVSIAVSAGAAVNLTDGLIGYWPLDGERKDVISGQTFDAGHYDAVARLRLGVNGFGTQVDTAGAQTLYSYRTLQETPRYPDDTTNRNTIPAERWRTISLWIKYDPQADTNNACGSVLAEVRFTLGLFYDRTNGTDRVAMYQQTMCSEVDGRNPRIDYYTASGPSFDNRWVHICGVFDRQNPYATNESELWIDGVKQPISTRYMGGGRIREEGSDKQYLQFGNINATTGTSGPNDRWDNRPRTFPGVLDEIRLYNRKLTESEIRFLAANPVVDVNRAPAADIAAVPSGMVKGETAAVGAVAGDDGMPTGSALTGQWIVLSGNAADLVFADPAARETTATALKAGTYTLAYKVSDGEKTTYSDPQTFGVAKPGLMLILK